MQKNNDEKFIKKCIKLARKSEGQVSPNPLVGAIIIDKKGQIAAEGRHEKYGSAHAEVNAFSDAQRKGIDVNGGTLYVSLEPCSHYGKTPPCADLIIEKNIKKVVIGCVDPNPKVSGNGIKKLKDAGIEVECGILEQECQKLNEIFMTNQLLKRPFVVIKTATTTDGKIAVKSGDSKWITSEKARENVQRLRNRFDAILTGSGTVIKDNPSLTCRMKNGRNPIRIVIDSCAKTAPASKVYADDGTKVILAVAKGLDLKNIYEKNVEILPVSIDKTSGKIDLNELISELYEKGICSIMIEAGGLLNSAFLNTRKVDKIYQYIAPKLLGDKEAKSFAEGFCAKKIDDCIKLELEHTVNLAPDMLLEYKVKNDSVLDN